MSLKDKIIRNYADYKNRKQIFKRKTKIVGNNSFTVTPNEQRDTIVYKSEDNTLDSFAWKDSFDKLLNTSCDSKKIKKSKKHEVRRSYNMDSSAEMSNKSELSLIEMTLTHPNFDNAYCSTPFIKKNVGIRSNNHLKTKDESSSIWLHLNLPPIHVPTDDSQSFYGFETENCSQNKKNLDNDYPFLSESCSNDNNQQKIKSKTIGIIPKNFNKRKLSCNKKSANTKSTPVILTTGTKKKIQKVQFIESVIPQQPDVKSIERCRSLQKPMEEFALSENVTKRKFSQQKQKNLKPVEDVRTNRDSNKSKRKTVMFDIKELETNLFIEQPDKVKELVLAPGKWRKSISVWRHTIQSLDKRKSKVESNNFDQRSSNRRISFKLTGNITTKLTKKMVKHLQDSLSESVLEQTDDGVYNLSTLSIRDESIKQSKVYQKQRSVICQPTTKFDDDPDFQNRKSATYQKSYPRGRRTSVVVSPGATSNNFPFQGSNEIDLVKKLNPKEIVLRRCQQTKPLGFDDIYSANNLKYCRKIGEGVYGEVFMNKNKSGEAIVLKIIPIEGNIEVNGEPQKKFDEILAEIVIAMELSNLRNGKNFMTNGFVEVINVRCVKGRYPEHLIELWELYRDNRGTDNDHPEIFSEDQLYIVLELANAGQDLEAFTFDNALQSYSAFLQTAITLAIAESKFEFEHRDLHWGNILLIATNDEEVVFKLNGNEIKIPTHGVKVTIIDYTLSRMVYKECNFYNDLAHDEELFTATGDYQFDIYRFMKTRLDNQWDRYEPYTNVLWLHYTIDKMINGARYRSHKNKKHRTAIHDMMQLRDELLDYKSTSDYIKGLY